MVLYVVIYSIAILLILVLTIVTSIYIVKKNKNICSTNLQKADKSPLTDYVDSLKNEAFIIVNKNDFKVDFASSGISYFFDYTKEEVEQDLNVLYDSLTLEIQKKIKYSLVNWDYITPIVLRYHFKESELLEEKITCVDDKLIYYFTDVTASTKHEAEMNSKMNELILQTQSRMNYLSNMSHEIRTPMNGIIGLVDLIKDNLGDNVLASDYLNKIDELSSYLLSLINDILDISKLDSGKFVFSKDVISIKGIADKLNNMFSKTIAEK